MSLQNQIRKLMRYCGVDIIKYNSKSHPLARLINLLREYKTNLVFDVGANIGQYACLLRNIGYKGRIVSFEPLESAFRELERIAKYDEHWDVENIGLGSCDGNKVINVAANSQSSSILDMLPLHLQSFPNSMYIGSEEIILRTIDSMLDKYYRLGDRVFMKIDSQGYEKHVLEGAKTALTNISGVELEMSLSPLYEGEILFPEMNTYMVGKGFSLMSLEPVIYSKTTGQLLQVNGVFFRLKDRKRTL